MWLTQGSTVAPDQTQHSVPRRNLDLETDTAIDLASHEQEDEMDPMLAEADKDYRTRTNVQQY